MSKNTIISDQLYNWSDNEPFRFPCRADPATSGPAQAAAPARAVYSAGFVDRTLQALRQTGLQVCPGSRAWPQVLLSVSQPDARPQMDYVPVDYSQQVFEYLHNFQQVRQLLEQICNLNRELLRRRTKF